MQVAPRNAVITICKVTIFTSILINLGLGVFFVAAQKRVVEVDGLISQLKKIAPSISESKGSRVLGVTSETQNSGYLIADARSAVSSLNLLSNSSFEGGNLGAEPKSWGYIGNAGSFNAQVSDASIRSGATALRMNDSTASSTNRLHLGISQPRVSTVNGREYVLSVYLRTQDLVGNPKLRVGFQGGKQVGEMHGGKDRFSEFPLSAGSTGSWKNFSFTYPSAALGKYPSIEIVGYQGGFIFLDDASMYQRGAANGTPSLHQAVTSIGDGSILIDAAGNLYPAEGYGGSLGLADHRWTQIIGERGSFSSDLTVGGQLAVDGSVNLNNTLKVGGATTFNGITTFNNTVVMSGLAVAGTTSFENIIASGNADIAGSLYAGTNNGFAVNTSGNITSVNGVTYSWPASQGEVSSLLQNDGSGGLSWATLGAASITADSLDFTEFKDSMTLDASTDIGVTGSDVFSVTNSGSGLSFRVNDQTSDTTPFVVDASGLVGIGTTSPTVGLTVLKDIGWTAETNSALATFRRTSTDDGIAIGYWSHNGLADGGGAITAMGGSSLILGTDTNPRSLSVYSNGRVFIGQTVSPNTDQLLTINGGLTVSGNGTTITESTTYPSVYGADIIPGNLGSGDLILSGRNSANQSGIAFVTGASGTSALRMFITYDGKVSIGGTSAPANKLDIRDASAGDLLTLGGTAAVTTKLGFTAGGNSYLDAVNTGILHLRTNGSDRLTINASGNVGIGTTSPGGRLHVYTGASGQATPYSSGDELVVEGSGATGINILSPNTTLQRITFGDNNSAAQGILVYNHTNDSFGIGTNGNDGGHFYINSSGNVGIGTTSLSGKLHVYGPTDGSSMSVLLDATGHQDNNSSLKILSGNATGRSEIYLGDTNDNDIGAILYHQVDNKMQFKTNDAVAMTMLSSGYVGIGTTSPQGQLHLKNATGGITNSIISLDTTINANAGGGLEIWRGAAGASTNLGRLSMAGYADNFITGAVANDMVLTIPNSNSIIFGNSANGVEWARIKNGNVGIGNTNPTYQLDISSSSAGASMFRAVRAATSRGLTLTSDGVANFVSSSTTLDGIFNFSLETALARETSAAAIATGVKFTIPITLTAGSDANNSISLGGTVNQSAGTGITRGLYLNQTITAASDYRALEITSGKAIFGGNVGIGTTNATGQLTMTGTAKNAQGTFLNLTDNVDNNDANYPARILFVDNNGAVASHMRKGLQVDFSGTSTFTDRSITALISNSLLGSQAITFGQADTGNNALQVKTTGSTAGGNRAGMFMASGGATNVGAEVIASGTATTNIAGYFSASGGTSNYAFVVPSTGGNVGIGTTAPSKLLHVQKSDSDTTLSNGVAAVVRISNSDATLGTYSGIEFGQYGSDYTHAFIGAIKTSGTTTGTSDLVFATKSSTSDNTLTEYMRIASAGTITMNALTSCSSGIQTNGSGVLSCISSDENLKTNIQQIQDPLTAITQLRGVTYNWKDSNQGDGLQYGFIAQDVEKVVPGLTFTAGDGVKGVKYQQMVGLVVEGMKQQQLQIENLQTQLSASGSTTLASTAQSNGQVLGLSYSIPEDEIIVTKVMRFTEQVIIDATTTFMKPVKFLSEVVFSGKVKFTDQVTFASNMGGEVVILPGTENVEVKFTNEFRQTPVVTANVVFKAGTDAQMLQAAKEQLPSYLITNVTAKGFTLQLQKSATTELHFQWIALDVASSSPTVGQSSATPEPTVAPTVAPTASSSSSPTPTTTSSPSPTASSSAETQLESGASP